MSNLYADIRFRIRKDEIIHVKRSLPNGKGAVKVSVGQEVTPDQILGEGKTSVGFMTVDLAQQLKVSSDNALSYLKREMGQNIFQGEILAAKEDLFGFRKKMVFSPADGVIDYYDREHGRLRIKFLPKNLKLASGVYGVVDKVDDKTGTVWIRTMASIVYGVVGSGMEREGTLKVLGSSEMLMGSRQIVEEDRKHIVVGGGMAFLDALQKAVDLGVSGVIAGGINARDFRAMSGGSWNISHGQWSDVGLTLMATEGFGSTAIGSDIFPLLQDHQGEYVILDGNRAKLTLPTRQEDSMMYIRKARLPVDITPETPLVANQGELKVGVRVRVLSAPYLGSQGVIDSIDRSPTRLPSGITTFVVTVATASRKLRIPYQNLEIVI